MTEQEMMTLLRKKLDRGMAQYRKEWQQKPASKLVELASEIAAVKFVYEELSDGRYSAEYMEYLLRFENPLEVVKDQWISEQNVDFSEELTHALWTLWDKGESESEYALDPEYAPVSAEEVRITVREFIEAHPNAAFDMAHRCVDARWDAVRQPDRQPDYPRQSVAGLARRSHPAVKEGRGWHMNALRLQKAACTTTQKRIGWRQFSRMAASGGSEIGSAGSAPLLQIPCGLWK